MVMLSRFPSGRGGDSPIHTRRISPERFRCVVPWAAVAAVWFLTVLPAAAGDIVYQVHSEMKTALPASPKLGLIQPSVYIYQVSAGGVTEKIQDWCDSACENVRAAVQDRFGGDIKIIPVKQLESDVASPLDEEVRELQALYDAVTVTISNTWAGQFPFPKDHRRFDYSLGDLDQLLEALEVDGLIFVSGTDQIKTGGRKTFEFVSFLAGVVYFKSAYLDVGLVGPSGKLLWYRLMGSLPQTDLREPEGAKAYIEAAFKDFPVE